MPLSSEEYKRAWDRTQPAARWCDGVTPETAVLDKSFRSSMMGEGFVFVDDFGHAIGYCRYCLMDNLQPPARKSESSPESAEPALPGLQMMEEAWHRHLAGYGADELARRWKSAEAGFDVLLEQFVRDGYRPEMGTQLMALVNANSIDLELHDVYVLPSDLERLLEHTRNPLAEWDEETGEPNEADAPPFDLSNPEHREALAGRMYEMFR